MNTNTEKSIILALENGFEPEEYKVFSLEHKNLFDIHRGKLRICSHFGEYIESLTYRDVINRPEFFKALGKGLGWDNPKIHKASFCPVCDHHIPETIEVYKYHWHRFIDHLDEGKDIENFFTNLIDNK